jgi:hypothetical protein
MAALRLILACLFAALLTQARAGQGQQGPEFDAELPAPSRPTDPKSIYPEVPPEPAGTPAPSWSTVPVLQPWTWQAVPEGLMYRSYLAGVKEPRLGVMMGHASDFGTIWDVQLGGRVGLVRYGTTDAYRPEGWQLDFFGTALPRLQPLEPSSPLVSTDFTAGFPITYARGPWQFKTGYSHLSSHLGDEYMLLHPTIHRINYVRDSIMFGVGYYYTDDLRLFGEVDYAVGVCDGAQPWDFQVGFDYSPAVRTGAIFVAAYGDLRPEVNGGFFVFQTGWQCRGGAAMHTLRVGVQYLNGKSPQFEFFRRFEQTVGFGTWYDY